MCICREKAIRTDSDVNMSAAGSYRLRPSGVDDALTENIGVCLMRFLCFVHLQAPIPFLTLFAALLLSSSCECCSPH